jgi:hypothetical protein
MNAWSYTSIPQNTSMAWCKVEKVRSPALYRLSYHGSSINEYELQKLILKLSKDAVSAAYVT